MNINYVRAPLIKKAFNSVPHFHLLNLLQSLSFLPILINWLCCYLLNHSQSVFLNGVTSFSRPVSSGVPQFSILGPLLFLLYGVSNLPLSSTSCHILYADDILLFKPVNSLSDFSHLQLDLDSISQWFSSSLQLLTLNSSESKHVFHIHDQALSHSQFLSSPHYPQ